MPPKKTSSPKPSSKKKPRKTKDTPVLPSAGYLSESWTDRGDALEILTKCATLIRGFDVLAPDSRCGGGHLSATDEAVKLINACELALKKESFRSVERIEQQKAEILQPTKASGPMNFEDGVQFLKKLKDKRHDRLEKALVALIRKDFDACPRGPRHVQEFRRIRIEGLNRPPCREEFTEGELVWYKEKGFTSEDLTRLGSYR